MSADSETRPGYKAAAVSTSDSTNFAAGTARSLYIGGAGDAVVVMPDGTAITFAGLAAGTILPVYCKRVNATSTTATNIVAIY